MLIKHIGLKYITSNSSKKRRVSLYSCDKCKIEFEALDQNQKSKNLNLCKKCCHIGRGVKHGKCNTRLYNIWRGMKQRCLSKSNTAYKYYGEKGITIYDAWKENFQEFYDWALSSGYKEHLTIDRIDPTKNYEPINCRWTSMEIQRQNTRLLGERNTLGYRGISLHKKSGKYKAGIKVCNKYIHLGYFNTKKEGAKAYDLYVLNNNLPRPLNSKLEDIVS